MNSESRIDIVAAALADRARSIIVCALMDGRAYTAKELAYRAQVTPQTASFHLQRLVDSGLLSRHAQGRNRYYHIAGFEVAEAIETLMTIAPTDHLRPHRTRAGEELLQARSCYDHIAGHLGILIADRLTESGALLSRGGDFALTPHGITWLAQLGLDIEALQAEKRPLVRHCLDWTERRFHISGALGAALLRLAFSESWLRRDGETRRLTLTPKGRGAFRAKLGLALETSSADGAGRYCRRSSG